MSVFTESARRNAEIQRPHIGGPYGTGSAEYLGYNPGPRLIFFDDGVRIEESAPTTKHYSASTWTLPANRVRGFFAGVTGFASTEFFLKLASPVSEIASLCVALRNLRRSIFVATPNASATYVWVDEAILVFNLIKQPMTVGVSGKWGLDELTYNNSNWGSRDAAHGTNYDTATDYDSFSGNGASLLAHLKDYDITISPAQTGGGPFSNIMDVKSGIDINEQNKIETTFSEPSGDRALKADGPYSGIHMYWRHRDPSETHLIDVGAGLPALVSWAAGDFYSFSMEVQNPRRISASAANRRNRGYVLDDSFYF